MSCRSLTRVIALIPLLMLTGCLLGPKYHPPTSPTAKAPNYKESTVNFQAAPGWKVANPQEGMLRGKWWGVFKDPQLNALEEQLEINNQNIKLYFQNLLQARALVAQARSMYWPTVTLAPSWNRAKTSGTLTNSTFANAGFTSTFIQFPIDVSWTPDFWGKIRNEVRFEQYSAQVSAADLEVEKLTEETTLAQLYFEIRGQDALEKVLQQTVAADQNILDLTQALYDTGIDDYSAVVGAKATLQSAQTSLLDVGIARAQYEHAIAVLLGRVATDFSIATSPLLTTPPPIPTGVPAQLLERRPDVAATERTLAAANATIGIGYGAFFPDVTISASGGFESSTFPKLFHWPSRFWSIGPSISQVIFNAGLYRAELNQYTAIYNADLANYRQTVLTAFQQVEDDLAATRIYSQEVLTQQAAVNSAQQLLDLETARYQTGVDPYISVLTAQATLLVDQETLVALHIDIMVSAVNLIEALGGGWDLSQLPTPSQVTQKVPAADYKLQR